MKKILSLLLVFGLIFNMTAPLQADSGFEFKSYLYDLEYPPRILLDTRASQFTTASGPFDFGLEVSEAFTLDQLIVFSAPSSSASLTVHLTQIVDANGNNVAEDQQAQISWSTEVSLFDEESCFQLSTPVRPLEKGVYYFSLEGSDFYLNENQQPVLLLTDRPAETTGLTLNYLDAAAVENLTAPQQEDPGEDSGGYVRSFIAGYNLGYDERYDEGVQAGYEQGYADAAESAEQAPAAEPWGKIEQLPDHIVVGVGAEQGYADGYALGSQLGYEDGCADGYQQGYAAYIPQEQDEQGESGLIELGENLPYAPPEHVFDSSLVVFIESIELEQPLPSAIQDGRTLVAMQPLLEQLGFAFSIDEETRRIDIMSSDPEELLLSLDLDSPMVVVYTSSDEEGQEMILDVPAQFMAGSYMIPLRFVAETLGFEVVWSETEHSISIFSAQD